MANEDVFKYNPISEWNGDYVDFGMPSTDGDIRLTEICLAAESCLEATKNAMDLSFTSSGFAKARTAPVLKIVRTLFGEDTGINISTFQAMADDGSVHFMSPMVSAAMELVGYDWVYEIVNNNMALTLDPFYYDTWTDPYDEKPVRTYTKRETHAINPLSSSAGALTTVTTGNRPVTGNWDTDGEPYWEISWDSASTGRCSDNVQTNQSACESTVLGGYCREGIGTGRGYCSNSAYRNNEASCLSFGICSDPAYNNNESGCVGNSNVWIPSYTWSSSEGTPPRAIKKDNGHCENPTYDGNESTCTSAGFEWYAVGYVEANIDKYGDHYCLYADVNNGGNGKCFYSSNNLDTDTWYAYGSTEAWCLDYAANNDGWAHLWWMWIPPQNDWTEVNAVWRPTTGADYGTYPHFSHWNIKTSKNHRLYPENHISEVLEMMGSTRRVYHSDINSSWGNGEEVGRSTIPLWVTSTYDWPNNDLTYDYCHDPGYNTVDEWSSRGGYYDQGTACLAAGDCTGEWVHSFDQNDQASCESWFRCSDHSLDNNNNSGPCLNNDCCSNPGYTSSWICTNSGTCSHSGYNNNPSGCTNAGYSYSYYGYTWGPNHCGRTWYQANTFTSHNNTWDAVTPDVEVEIPIYPEYLWKPMFPPHTFVNTTDSRPLDEQGYTGTSYPASELHASQSQIRWRPPQRTSNDYSRTYPRPTKFRIYRAPAYYQGYQANTDFTEEVWKLAGEVITKSDSGYHYFYDTREDMVTEGLMEYQHAYYGITAVWEDWNWKRGFTIKYYSGMDPDTWDIHCTQGQSRNWDAYLPNYWTTNAYRYEGLCSNTNYTTQETCEGNGACLPSNTHSDYNNDEAACLAAGGTWSSSGYIWSPGNWSGNPNNSADLDLVETTTPTSTYLQKHVRINDDTDNRTYRASGYFKAPVSGEFQFEVKGDDPVYMWLGTDQQSISGLVGARSWYNYLTAVPGYHGDRLMVGTITLVEGGIYPLLAYGANEGGPATFEIRINYPSGDWNDNNGSEWKYVPILMGPEDMVLEEGGGQTVEGHWAATSVPAWYTNFP
jgi:hypothetical protein